MRLLLIFGFGLAACSTMAKRDAIGARAERDLPCPKDEINVTHVGKDSYKAEGCGAVAHYICVGDDCSREQQKP